MGSSGIEPPTSRLSGVRSNRLSYEPIYGGDEEIRTPDPLLARQVLSQLSYTPITLNYNIKNIMLCQHTTIVFLVLIYYINTRQMMLNFE